ncbi:hypothetical protein LINGRAHAP2_LOCUS15129, partial [Linum grandiflorum]
RWLGRRQLNLVARELKIGKVSRKQTGESCQICIIREDRIPLMNNTT